MAPRISLKREGKFDIRLVNDVFTPTERTLKEFEAIIRVSLDWCPFHWSGSSKPPKPPSGDVAVVLDITLGTLEETIRFAWEWLLVAGHDMRIDVFFPERFGNGDEDFDKIDFAKYQLLEGAPAFEPRTLRWRLIRLDANLGESCFRARDPRKSPGVAAIFAAAQHPYRLEAIDGKRHRYSSWWIPGLRYGRLGVCGVDFKRDERDGGRTFAMIEQTEYCSWGEFSVPEFVDID